MTAGALHPVLVMGPACPLPGRVPADGLVQLAHGGGGRLTRDLIERVFVPQFANPALAPLHDGAVFDAGAERLALSTDSYVVIPPEFPGGTIGSLAVHGTVNDLAMCGARATHLSAGFILQEGFPLAALHRIAADMGAAARACGVEIVTGDTKVVEGGRGGGILINTAGVGRVRHLRGLLPANVRPGDAVIVSGDLGRHGVAVLAAREGLSFETTLRSDSAPVHEPALALQDEGIPVACLRDLTRGGLAAALIEIAAGANAEIAIDESALPIHDAVHGACEILGLDPIHIACEGRFIAFVPEAETARTLAVLRRYPVAAGAIRIGTVTQSAPGGRVLLTGPLGVPRLLDLPSGEPLPRIC